MHTPPPPLEWPHYGIGFAGAVRRGFAKYATFTGRAGARYDPVTASVYGYGYPPG